jgi:hypothetical protein
MLLNAGMSPKDGFQWRWMKMACGENPIRSYGAAHWVSPETRLGEGYLFRKRIDEAAQVVKDQDQWCREAENSYSAYGRSGHHKILRRFPNPIQHESLVALLRGKIRLNFHCYEV